MPDTRSRLGEILVTNGSITQEQLSEAFDRQAELKLPIGRVLLELHYVSDETMRQALGQLNVPYLDLDHVVIDRGLAKLVEESFAKGHVLVPVARMGSTLTVAMNDPTALPVVEELERMTGFTVNAVTSSASAIVRAFRRIYEDLPAVPESAPPPAAPASRKPVPPAPMPAAAGAHAAEPHATGIAKKTPSNRIALSLDWGGDMKFRNSWGSPVIELHSGTAGMTSPPQALAYAVMACMGMDVVHVLQKGRQDLRGLAVRFEGLRTPENPRRFIMMHLHFDITGRVDAHVVERAIELSRTKYCSVWNSLKTDIELVTTHSVHD